MKLIQKPLFVLGALSSACLGLTGCEQNYGLAMASHEAAVPAFATTSGPVTTGTSVSPDPAPAPAPVVSHPPVVVPPEVKKPIVVTPPVAPPAPQPPVVVTKPAPAPASAVMSESFNAASKQVKKIDFLFVIDNSPSMSDNQKKLARGFRAFANTFYRRSDLDICTMIITSDRYLGKEGEGGYQRERPLPCTKPAGSEKWSPDQMEAHIDALIDEFLNEAYVGVDGSPAELLGKSLVTFLYGLPQWGDRTDVSQKSSFFRKDAVANITLITDENNYFFDGPDMDESKNDLPYSSNIDVPGAKNGEKDTRQGIKEYVDQYFASVNPGHTPTYSMTSILELTRPTDTIPGLAVNLDMLPAAIGRESTKSDVSGNVKSFTDVYQSISDAIVLRATMFELAKPVLSELRVRLRHPDGSAVELNARDYTLQASKKLTLDPKVLPLLQIGDQIEVSYRYQL